ncbi:MAG: OsmC family protein [Chitinophagaceae bacterium]
MTSSVIYNGDLRTYCVHQQSSSSIETDAPTDNNGKGERFSPTDLMATSLASCMLTVMGIKSRTMDVDLKGVEVAVEKIMKADPRRIGGITLSFKMPESLSGLDEKSKQILKNAALTCPVAKSIHPDIELILNWNW